MVSIEYIGYTQTRAASSISIGTAGVEIMEIKTLRKRTDYKVCKKCGASLDVGEKCDCTKIKYNFKALKGEHRSRYKITAKVPYGKWGKTV